MRLHPLIIEFFKNEVSGLCGNPEVFLFGSRTDDSKKGGDIDILVISDQNFSSAELEPIYWKFQKKFGEQKLDIVSFSRMEQSNFKKLILQSAIKL